MTLLWCSSKLAQLYKLSLCNKINIQPFLVEYRQYCTLGSEYLPRRSALGNIPTFAAIFIDIPSGATTVVKISLYSTFTRSTVSFGYF